MISFAFVAVQVFRILILIVLARPLNLTQRKKIVQEQLSYLNKWWYCGRKSNTSGMQIVCHKTRVERKFVSFLGQLVPASEERANGVGVYTQYEGRVDPGDHRYRSRVVGAVEVQGTFLQGMGHYLPRVRRNSPPLISGPLSS